MQACCWLALASLAKPGSGDWERGSQQAGFMQKPHFMGGIYGHKHTQEPENPMVFRSGIFVAPFLKINGNILLLPFIEKLSYPLKIDS